MMACCLEYVDNSTLESWLRSDVMKKTSLFQLGGYSPGNDSRRRLPLHNQAKELTLDQSIFEGWKPPPNSNYLVEDRHLLEEVSFKVMQYHKYCQEETNGWERGGAMSNLSEFLFEGYSEKTYEEGKFQSWVKLGGSTKDIW